MAPNIGLVDVICDIVSSGSTLFKNSLKETHVNLKSEADLLYHFLVLLKAKNINLEEVEEVLKKRS